MTRRVFAHFPLTRKFVKFITRPARVMKCEFCVSVQHVRSVRSSILIVQ